MDLLFVCRPWVSGYHLTGCDYVHEMCTVERPWSVVLLQ